MLIYVDDIIITGSHMDLIQEVIARVQSMFAIRIWAHCIIFLGPRPLAILVVFFSLRNIYILDLLKKAKMEVAKPQKTPICHLNKLSKFNGSPFRDPTLYCSIVGAL